MIPRMEIINKIIRRYIIACSLLLIPLAVLGQVRLPQLISDGMVLQRNVQNKIWGWASPGENITIRFHGKTYHTVTGKDKKWSILLDPMKAGGPFKMEIDGKNHITLKNILIGDVWVSSGQSNMQHTMYSFRMIYADEIKNANNSAIRYFDVPQDYNFDQPQAKLTSGSWVETNPKTVKEFSAAAYFFAKKLYQKKHIPIGIINASVGGTPIQAWISEDALKGKFPGYYQKAQLFKHEAVIRTIQWNDQNRISAWYHELQQKDKGYRGPKSWFAPAINTTGWSTMNVPEYWANSTDLGNVHGVVWFRRTFEVPSEVAGEQALLRFGRIVNADSVYINGTFIGNTTYMYPRRRYKIPAGVLQSGKNTIVIRVVNYRGKGGFVPDKPYDIIAAGDTISLKGQWKYRLGTTMRTRQSQTFIHWKPTGLYNAMIAPLQDYSIKGVIWYQGASNTDRPLQYQKLFETLIKSWRKQWGGGRFPFLFVQLPNFGKPNSKPVLQSGWARLREAQLNTLEVPETGMAVTIDIGEWNDIHPLNKKDVGKRLMLAALKVAYGNDSIVFSSPLYQSMQIKDHSIIVTFAHVGKGLTTSNGKSPQEFIIAGKNGRYVKAKAKIIAPNKVKVWSKKVKDPVAVRYAWADNPSQANLYNSAGLPASPFKASK